MRNLLIAFLVLGGLYLISNYRQSRNYTRSDELFSGNKDEIVKVLIQKGGDAIELVKIENSWEIKDNDTLVVRKNRMEDLLENVLEVKIGTIVTKNPDKWTTYSVDDSLGIHLALIDKEENTIAYYVFGRSKSDYSHNNVRLQDEKESVEVLNSVYRTSSSVIHHLNTRTTFWGEKPPEPEPIDSLTAPVDTTAA